MHNLLHITDCVREFGSINSFSAYKFENYMSFINRLVRSKRFVLKQIFNRISEFNQLTLKHQEEECPSTVARKYSNKSNNCFVGLQKGRLGKIIESEGDIFTIQIFKMVSNFFSVPVESKEVGVHKVEGEGDIITTSINNIIDKYYGLPFEDGYILIRLL